MPVISNLVYTATDSTIVAVWNTDVAADSNLSASGKAAIDNGFQTSVTSHECIVTGLAPSTQYSCFVTSGGVSSSPQNVTTNALAVRTPITGVSNSAPTSITTHGDDVCSFVSNDNKTYVTEDDGYGFVTGTPNAGANMQLGVLTTEATLVGTTVNLLTNYGGFATTNGTDGPSGAALSNKQTGLFGMLGNLYMFQNRSYAPGAGHPLFQEFYGNIMMSPDKGATWNSWQATGTFSANGVPPSPLGSFQFANGNIGTIIPIRYAVDDGTIGYNTAGNQIDGANGYVYVVYQTGYLQNGNTLFLMRMPRVQFSIQSTTGLQYWAGPASPTPQQFVTDSNWTIVAANAVSIYTSANQVSNPDIIFIPAMNRYLMMNWYYPLIGAASPITTQSVWQILEAPTPAGPWTVVGTQTNSPSGWYMPKVMHRTAASNTLTSAVPLQLVYSGDYNAGLNTYYYPTYSTLTLNPTSGNLMIQLATDNFTRGSYPENPLGSVGFSDAGNWTTIPSFGGGGALQAVSPGLCEPVTLGANSEMFWSGGGGVSADGNWPDDQYSEVTISATATVDANNYYGPGVRLSATGGYIASMNVGSTSAQLYKLKSGGYTAIGSLFTATGLAPGAVLRLTVIGTTITLAINGTVLQTVTDSSFTSGAPGLYQNGTVATTANQYSLWAAGGNQAAPPTFSPNGGTFSSAQTAMISSSSGGTIYYTLDGTTPTHSSSSVSSGGTVAVSSSATLKAIASVSDMADSTVASVTFTINSAPPTGPITPLTVGVGSYQGSSITTAFPNVQGLDIFQVINEGGRVVWNLNAVGVAINNPTNPTPGTLLGQYEGSNFQAAFPNPYQLNIFQVISQGGSVVFYVDYQGNAAI